MTGLHGKKGADENFSFFIGYQNKVCTNLCVWTDGYSNTVGVKNLGQLKMLMNDLIINYNANEHLFNLEKLNEYELSEHQFAQLIGRCRMYQNLPTARKNEIAPMLYGDAQLNAVVKDYYRDNSFCRNERGNISLWKLYNLFTGVNKSSYIDSIPGLVGKRIRLCGTNKICNGWKSSQLVSKLTEAVCLGRSGCNGQAFWFTFKIIIHGKQSSVL